MQKTIIRLHRDLEREGELIRDREAELETLKRPSEMRNITSSMMELTKYLEETEERHLKQAKILDQIGEMISPRVNKKIKHKKYPNARMALTVISASRGLESEPSPLNTTQIIRKQSLLSPPKTDLLSEKFSFSKVETNVQSCMPPLQMSREPSLVRESSILGQKVEASADSPETQDTSPIYVSKIANIGANSFMQSQTLDESSDSDLEQFDAVTQTELTFQSSAETDQDSRNLPRFNQKEQRKHPFLAQLEKLPKQSPPMTDPNFFKLFELAMDEKAKADELDILQTKPLRTFTEFMLDFLFMQYGLKSLALKNLSSLVNSLERMSTNQHRYGILFCRLLEIFTDKPISIKLCSFLAKVRVGFCQISAKSSSKLSLEFGGEAYLADVYDLIGKYFASVSFTQNLDIGRSVFERIRTDLADLDKTAIIVCHRINKSGRDLKYLFLQIDYEKTGNISREGFVQRITGELGLYLAQANVEGLFDYLSEGTETLNFSTFNSRLNFKDLLSKAKDFTVTKADFLLAVIEEQEIRKERDMAYLKGLFNQADSDRTGALTLKQFADFLGSVDETLTSMAATIFREALEQVENAENPDAMSCDAFCAVALKHNIGGKYDVLETTEGEHDELVQLEEREIAVRFNRRNTFYRK